MTVLRHSRFRFALGVAFALAAVIALGATFNRFRDSVANLVVGNLTATDSISNAGSWTQNGPVTFTGDMTIGDSAGDTLTVNSTGTAGAPFSFDDLTVNGVFTANGIAMLNGNTTATADVVLGDAPTDTVIFNAKIISTVGEIKIPGSIDVGGTTYVTGFDTRIQDSFAAFMFGEASGASAGIGLAMGRTRGTIANPLPVENGDMLGLIAVIGQGLTNKRILSTLITFNVDDDPTTTAIRSNIAFNVAGGAITALNVHGSGLVDVGNSGGGTLATGNGDLIVSGDFEVNTDALFNGDVEVLGNITTPIVLQALGTDADGKIVGIGAPSIDFRILAVDLDTVGNVDGGEDEITTLTLLANTLNAIGESVIFRAGGKFGNTAGEKTINLYLTDGVTPSLLASFQAGVQPGGVWQIESEVFRTGENTGKAVSVFGGTVTLGDYASPIGKAWTQNLDFILTGESAVLPATDDIVKETAKLVWHGGGP